MCRGVQSNCSSGCECKWYNNNKPKSQKTVWVFHQWCYSINLCETREWELVLTHYWRSSCLWCSSYSTRSNRRENLLLQYHGHQQHADTQLTSAPIQPRPKTLKQAVIPRQEQENQLLGLWLVHMSRQSKFSLVSRMRLLPSSHLARSPTQAICTTPPSPSAQPGSILRMCRGASTA